MEGFAASYLLWCISVLHVVVSYVSSELSAEECLKMGFNRANLLCKSCDLLDSYDLSVLKNDCSACCGVENEIESGDAAVKKYASARLEVCG